MFQNGEIIDQIGKTCWLPVQIGPHSFVYHFYQTNAPKAYDGFGTLTIEEHGSTRIVGIRTAHCEWQLMRYTSGMHKIEALEDHWRSDIIDALWLRFSGKDGRNEAGGTWNGGWSD